MKHSRKQCPWKKNLSVRVYLNYFNYFRKKSTRNSLAFFTEKAENVPNTLKANANKNRFDTFNFYIIFI